MVIKIPSANNYPCKVSSSNLYVDYPCCLYDDYNSLSIVKLPLHYDLRELCPVQRS